METNELLSDSDKSNVLVAKAVYLMLVIGIAVGLLGIIAVVTATIYKKSAPEWLQTHFRFQVRTFWVGTVLMILGVISLYLLVGYFVLFLAALWIAVRCIRGLIFVSKGLPHPNPTGWLM